MVKWTFLMMIGFFFFLLLLLTQSVWHLVLVLLHTKAADEERRRPTRTQECKNCEKGVRIVSVEPWLWKQLKISPRNPPCSPGTVLLRGTFSLLLQVLLSFTGSHPLVHTAREEDNTQSVCKDSFRLLWLVMVMKEPAYSLDVDFVKKC